MKCPNKLTSLNSCVYCTYWDRVFLYMVKIEDCREGKIDPKTIPVQDSTVPSEIKDSESLAVAVEEGW